MSYTLNIKIKIHVQLFYEILTIDFVLSDTFFNDVWRKSDNNLQFDGYRF